MRFPPVDHAHITSLLEAHHEKCNVIIDTDTYNEIDDQFAIIHALLSENFTIKAIQAAPFHNVTRKTKDYQHGMEMSYEEIHRVLEYSPVKFNGPVLKGSRETITATGNAIESDAATNIIETASAKQESPLYILTLGAVTNVVSAIIQEPTIRENIVVVALGGPPYHVSGFHEFNFAQDIEATKALFDSGVALVQVPGFGVSELLRTTRWEMEQYVQGHGEIGDYLFALYEEYVREFPGRSKPIWDLAPGAFLINPEWMRTQIRTSPIVDNDIVYSFDMNRHPIRVVDWLNRDEIFKDFFAKLHKATETTRSTDI